MVNRTPVLKLPDKAMHMAKPNSERTEKYNPALSCAQQEWHQNISITLMTQISPKSIFVTVVIKCCYFCHFDHVLHCYL